MGWYYTIRIVLVYLIVTLSHTKNEEFLVCFWISVFSMLKRIGQTLGKENHTFMLGKSQTTSIKSWQALNMNSPCVIRF
jgi:hypothetical protein